MKTDEPFNLLKETEKNTSFHHQHTIKIPSIKELRKDLEMYDILELLGAGSTGIVYRAIHKQLKRPVAIKMLKQEYFHNTIFLYNFRKEARIISRIKHQNVASVYDFIETGNRYYLIMELIEGESLAIKMQKKEFDEKNIIEIMLGLLEGLRFTHNKDILHLDLKPSNILLNAYGEPVIVDFGIAKIKRSRHQPQDKLDKMVLGTPYYMAPEQYLRDFKQINFPTDIYSLGIIFYELLSKKLPFLGKDLKELKHKIINEEPKKISDEGQTVSEDLEAIVFKMLKKNPLNRYPDAQSVIDDIKRYQNGEPVRAQRYRPVALLANWIKKNLAVSLLTLLVLLSSCSFLYYYIHKHYQETPSWKEVFREEFNKDSFSLWDGYRDFSKGYVTSIEANDFQTFFPVRLKKAWFRSKQDLILCSKKTFNRNIYLRFDYQAQYNDDSQFGFFTAESIEKNLFGYIIYFFQGRIYLLRDNLVNSPLENVLWSGDYHLEPNNTYNFEWEILDERISFRINNQKILEFQDFINVFSEQKVKVGFFSSSADVRMDNLKVFGQHTALLITPLDVGNRLFQLGRYSEAVEEYNRVISEYPKHKIALEALYLRGITRMQEIRYVEAINDFNEILSFPKKVTETIKGKAYYQKAVCLLHIDEYTSAFDNFNYAIEVYNIPSLRSNVINTIVDFSRKKIEEATEVTIKQAEELLKYLLFSEIHSRISFIDIPKKIVFYYLEQKEYEKAIKTLNLLIRHYSNRRDIIAFALWKKGRAYLSQSENVSDNEKIRESYVKKAIVCFKKVVLEYSDIQIYNFFSYEELAKAYRKIGEFEQAIQCEKEMARLQELFL